MTFRRQWLLVLLALILGGGQLFAAPSREERAYTAAVAAFHDEIYGQAEAEFAQFIQHYPKSSRAAEAALYQAQAQFKQGKYTEAITTLSAPQGDWSPLADQYAYWLGEAQFARGDFDHAATTFTNLANNFPDSPLRLTSVVEAAAAFEHLGDWPQLERLLGQTNGVFALKAAQDSGNELVSRGCLLLAQAQLTQENYAGANATLKRINPQTLTPALDWQRASLQCRAALGAGDLDTALAGTTNLLMLARQQQNTTPARLADSVALRGTVFERMGRWADAATTWRENLAPGTPEERQREAILKLAAAAVAQNDFTNAAAALAEFRAQFSNSPVADLALLTQGELNLKQFNARRTGTNYLAAALRNFDQLLATDSVTADLAGQAYLNRGWCYWLMETNEPALADFLAAAGRLPFSKELAVARFKAGDAQFALKDFAGARTNYQAVLDDFGSLPEVEQSLGDRALYQIVRAGVELRDKAGAERAMKRLLEDFPKSELRDNAELLLGEGLSAFDSPTNALGVFRDFIKQFPNSPLRPQAELDVARTLERGRNWPAAIASYENWLMEFPTNDLRPEVEYSLGWAEYQAGDETNALSRFAGFVTQFPTNALAPVAQWWVADYFFRQGGTNYSEAEKNYEYIFQNTNAVWKRSSLFYPAQLMAGRSAAGRLGFPDAAHYFNAMTADTNCPPDMRTQALFAYGGILMRMDSTDTNRPTANFEEATNVFAQLCLDNPTNELGALACSEQGDCNLQLGAFEAATNAYLQAMNSPYAGVGLRCRAQVGLGRVLEKMAESAPSDERKLLLDQALKNYLEVFQTSIGKGLDDSEVPEAFWVKKAGLQILPLLSANGNFPANFFDRMELLLPQLKESLEKKKAALEAEKK